MNYRETRFSENMNFPRFDTVGEFDIPVLQPYRYQETEFIGFNFALREKQRNRKSLHFFCDDYRFERIWRDPTKYIDLLSDFQSVTTPDFSLYTDYPKALQIYNHYRKQWLGAFWQSWGLNVIPTIACGDKNSFEWCFDGIPQNATVAVSSVGTQNSPIARRLFLLGWEEMLSRLQPETVLFHGKIPQECEGNIIRIEAFQERLKEVNYGR